MFFLPLSPILSCFPIYYFPLPNTVFPHLGIKTQLCFRGNDFFNKRQIIISDVHSRKLHSSSASVESLLNPINAFVSVADRHMLENQTERLCSEKINF